MPGAAVATTSSAPPRTRRFERRRMPWSSRYSSSASLDVMRAGHDATRRRPAAAFEQRELVVAKRPDAEEPAQPALALDVDDEDPQTRLGRGGREGRGHRGFAHAALPGHDDKTGCGEERQRIQPSPFGGSVCADYPACAPPSAPSWSASTLLAAHPLAAQETDEGAADRRDRGQRVARPRRRRLHLQVDRPGRRATTPRRSSSSSTAARP